LYNVAFPVKEDKRKQKDREKPWLDDPEFKDIVREKGEPYCRKVKGQEREGDLEGLAEVTKEVNRTRLRRAYFSQRLEERMGDARATWEVLLEVLGGGNKKAGKVGCGFFRKDGVGLTGKVEVADRFCEFYLQVGPKLAAKNKREREGAFLDYMGDRVSLLEANNSPGGGGVMWFAGPT
jgi:hypothetical protein